MPAVPQPPHRQSLGEELANALSHALGCVLALAAMPALAQQARVDEHPLRLAGLTAFVGSLTLMFLVSSLYHALPLGRAKVLLRRFDHASIFVFIAGSCTPFALVAINRGGDGWLLSAVWAVALAGVALKLWLPLHRIGLWTLIYIAFSLLAGAMAGPALALMSADGQRVFGAGAIAYLLGVVFFLLGPRLRYSHFVWHLFVIGGSACHCWAVLQVLG